MTCGAHVSVTGVMKYTSSYTLQLGSGCVHTYSVAFLWETNNYNDMLQNRQIVMTFLRTSKIIMTFLQLTLFLYCRWMERRFGKEIFSSGPLEG